MEVQARSDASSFLAETLTLRTREPIRTNLIGSIAQGVLGGRAYDVEVWLTVHDADDVVGCALRTGPHNAVLSPMPIPAARALGRWMAANDPAVPGLTGPWDVVQAAADATGRSLTVRMREVARVLSELQTPRADRPTAGASRLDTPEDLGLVLEWLVAFEIEAHLPHFANRQHTGEQIDSGRTRLWCVDGAPVALGGHAPVVPTPAGTIGRIGPVYTPPEHRRRGYGAAVTRAVATELLRRCDQVMLFADVDNRDSNSIYAAMGFDAVAEMVDASFATPG